MFIWNFVKACYWSCRYDRKDALALIIESRGFIDESKSKPFTVGQWASLSSPLTLTQNCSFCGCHRFTDNEVEILSRPNLTLDEFNQHFKERDHQNKGICNRQKCLEELYVLTDGFNTMDLTWHLRMDAMLNRQN